MANTLIFDIGKTNKKCFLFDENYQEIWKEYVRFDEIEDEDGFPCDDIQAITDWVKTTFEKLTQRSELNIKTVNFSTYGASFVHLDSEGNILTPLYNYLKPYPKKVLKSFHKKYGSVNKIARQTASPASGMLNSGLQLYWLKQTQPETYQKIHRSLHFPQYLSYLFTGIAVSDFTSTGCHTSLWNYAQTDYHAWVYAEGINEKLPPIVATDTSINKNANAQFLRIGVGIHDSSAALLPYLRASQQPFLLISTGTWSITLNPFSESVLSKKDLKNDGLNYLRIDGKPVRATRLFLGKEYSEQVQEIRQYFKVSKKAHHNIKLDASIIQALQQNFQYYFKLKYLNQSRKLATDLSTFPNFTVAYHQLMLELVEIQIKYIQRAMGDTPVQKIYIDGGFADNDLFVKLIAQHFSDLKIRRTQSPLGSALGASMVLSEKPVKSNFLKKHYALKK